MSRFDSLAIRTQGVSENAAFRQDKQPHRQPCTRSDSEDNAAYILCRKGETEGAVEDTQLTAQALNTDGTPKRPMNAFMIFARRRRPQVSAANQAMRTGEISKILSKEWNAMEMSDKQFYLDQAKRLKETFNSKYPDYVYKRRPNNSRKKRRSDAAGNPLEETSPSADPADDFTALQDFEYPSSVDSEEHLHSSPRDFAPSRNSHLSGIGGSFNDSPLIPSPHSSLSSYTYPPSNLPSNHFIPPANGSRGSQQLPPIHDRSASETPSIQSSHQYLDIDLRSHPYPPHSHTQQSHLPPSISSYGNDHLGGSGGWNGSIGPIRGEHGRSTQSNHWPTQPGLILDPRERNQFGGLKHDSYTSPHRSSSTGTAQAVPALSNPSPRFPQHASTYPLQNLTTSFSPDFSNSPGTYQSSTSSSSTPSASPETYYTPSVQLPHGRSSFGGRATPGYQHGSPYSSQAMHQSGPAPYSNPHDGPMFHQPRLSRVVSHSLLDGMPSLSPSSSSGDSHSSRLHMWERNK